MMHRLHRILALTLLLGVGLILGLPAQAEAQEETGILSIKGYGYWRGRGEFRNGWGALLEKDQKGALVFTQRIEVGAGLLYNKKFGLYVQVHDSRAWGQDDRASLFGLTAGYFEYLPCKWFSLRVGRQQIGFGNGFIFTEGGFSLVGISHDAILLTFKHRGLRTRWLTSMNTDDPNEKIVQHYYGDGKYKYLTGLLNEYTIPKWGQAQFALLVDVSQRPGKPEQYAARVTLGGGGYLTIPNTGLTQEANTGVKLDFSIFYQGGNSYNSRLSSAIHAPDSIALNYNAYAITSRLSYTPVRAATLAIGLDLVSGLEKNRDLAKNFGVFDRIFGSGHNFFGYANFFDKGLKNINYLGLRDLYLMGVGRYKKFSVEVSGHFFNVQKAQPSQAKTYMGFELDICGNYKFQSWLMLEFGVMAMFPSEFFRSQMLVVSSQTAGQFYYLSLKMNPTIEFERKVTLK